MQVARGLRAAAIGGALCAAPLVAQAQTGTVTGRVVDSTSQQPLSNVTVRVEGTQLGTLTRNDGTFTIGGVPAGARTLRAARVGFSARTAPVSVAAGGSASVNLALPALAAQLTEVVAVAYGSGGGQERRNVTGSVAAVDSAQFNKGRVVSAEDLIQAKVAGVQVVSSNEPGGGISVRVRGQASVNGNNDPLFVVDGIPLPSAAGSRGAATRSTSSTRRTSPTSPSSRTRRPRRSTGRAAPTASCSSPRRTAAERAAGHLRRQLQQPHGRPRPELLSADEFRQVVPQYGPASNVALLGTANTDWFDALSRRARSGAQPRLRRHAQDLQYRLSLGYLADEGVLRGDNTNRVSAQFNYADRCSTTARRAVDAARRAHARRVRRRPVLRRRARLGADRPDPQRRRRLLRDPQPAGAAQPARPPRLAGAQRPDDRAIGNLQLRANAPSSRGSRRRARQLRRAARARRRSCRPPTRRRRSCRHAARLVLPEPPDATTLVLDAFGNYTRRVNAIGADLDVTGGYSYETSTGNNASFTALGLGSDALGTSGIPAANRVLTPPVNIQERRLASFFGRANATIAERYLFGVSVRRDGSSRFGTNNQWGTFPAVSVGWRAYEESFLRGKLPGLSDLKFRYSYGINGNEPPGNYLAYSTYSYSIPQSQVQFGNVFIPTLAPSTANPTSVGGVADAQHRPRLRAVRATASPARSTTTTS
jgi:iron complex outermembrane receptor protein